MLQLLGKLISLFYETIGSYGLVLIIIGFIVGFSKLTIQINKLKNYKLKKKLQPEVEKINNMNLTEEQKTQRLNELFKKNNYNSLPSILTSVIISIVTISIFMVTLNPYKYIGIDESIIESFLYYNNIFDKSFDFILPIIVTLLQTFSSEVGKPLTLLNKKDILTKFITSLIMYLIFGFLLMHIYIIYCFGLNLGIFFINILLIGPKRKAYKE